MDISLQKSGDLLTISLQGRLDASWSATVQKALDDAVRAGEHRIALDLAKVDYISSAGLGVILYLYKQLHGISGHFAITAASPFVLSALKMAGLGTLLTANSAPTEAPPPDHGVAESSARATYEVFSLTSETFDLQTVGDPAALLQGSAVSSAHQFHQDTFAIGVGALGTCAEDCAPRFGEFLSVAGMAAFQPADGSTRPDFMVSQADFVPEGHLLYGLAGEGAFGLLARFTTKPEFPTVGLSELAETALRLAKTSSVALVAITETAGLVGTSLRQSPAPAATSDRFRFPEIRDWLAFSSERSHRDSTSLIVGVASHDSNSEYAPLLRPLIAQSGLFGHFHAAAFPYRPLQKGRIDLHPSVAALFEAQTVNAIVHLLSDPREFNGAGESEFLRGALWIAPLAETQSLLATP
ncbi:hypothetical protein BH09VER1_BH09VER1_06420 [soil metagenome]